MKLSKTYAVLSVLSLIVPQLSAQQFVNVPSPQAEHLWLKKHVGEWEYTVKVMPPGAPSFETTGTEVFRPLGDYWVVSETRSNYAGDPFTGQFTLGYDPNKKSYVGIWIDSASSNMWQYNGNKDEQGLLVLNTMGPSALHGGKTLNMQETICFHNPDHKTLTQVVDVDGTSVTTVVIDSHRKH